MVELVFLLLVLGNFVGEIGLLVVGDLELLLEWVVLLEDGLDLGLDELVLLYYWLYPFVHDASKVLLVITVTIT